MTNPFGSTQHPPLGIPVADAQQITSFLQRVYGWMFIGLALTAVVAMGVASSPSMVGNIVANRGLFYLLLFGELGLVWYLSSRVSTLSAQAAGGLFMLYSALNGVTLSVILLAFTQNSVAMAFVTTSAMFGGLALYGTVTKRSLAGVGQFAMMGLIGVVIASIVSIFWHNDMMEFVMSVVGVIVFVGLSMYDAQRLKVMAAQTTAGNVGSYAIVGALSLYLDFINLFLFILRLFGRRR